MSVGTNFSNNIQTYKNLLQNTGDKLKLIVNRNGELLQMNLQVKSIR